MPVVIFFTSIVKKFSLGILFQNGHRRPLSCPIKCPRDSPVPSCGRISLHQRKLFQAMKEETFKSLTHNC